jgi:hypothetical protein
LITVNQQAVCTFAPKQAQLHATLGQKEKARSVSVMREIDYRGYSIRFDFRNGRWSAHVRRPGGFIVIKDGFITATAEEGESGLLARARALIEQQTEART